jgi:hypothetical protein
MTAGGTLEEQVTPATNPNGGGVVSVEFPYTFVDGVEGDVTFAIYTVDDNGNSGAPVIVIHHIDRLAPGPVIFTTST